MDVNDRLIDEQTARDRLGGIGKTLFYELLKREEMTSVKIGRRRLVVESSVGDYIARLAQEPAARAAS